ncbi:hypothetical protein KDA11_00160 [Candidatus Saccharibacteria bacterium]|nr:hypothetical protein [Candidatus Saccharibacteria bacterium]
MRHPNRKPQYLKNPRKRVSALETDLLADSSQRYSSIAPRLANGESRQAFKIIDKLAKTSMPQGKLMAADMAIEVATKTPGSAEQKQELLGKARNIWQTICSNELSLNTISYFGARARIGLSILPAISSIAIDRTLPDIQKTNAMYHNLILTANDVVKLSIDGHKRGDTRTSKYAAGLAGELAVNLLLLRFDINELGGEGEVALPSFFSEDAFGLNKRTNHGNSAWDISVFTDCSDDNISLLHAIQVKHSIHRSQSVASIQEKYDSSIACVVVNSDLALKPEEHVGTKSAMRSIIGCTLSELNDNMANSRVTSLLDARTELLLDTLDARSLNPPAIHY